GKLFGFDVSAVETRRFTILPIPPLPAPTRLSPGPGHRFEPGELRNLSTIDFSWAVVPDATRYVFTLYRGEDAIPLVSAVSPGRAGYSFEDFTRLGNGDYRWTVTAQAFDGQGALEQDGTAAESRFSIDVPALRTPALTGKETFYGR
ncbi:MAG TPA: hypothetical protein VHE79_06115, partial [Spirochaetia bacterium]